MDVLLERRQRLARVGTGAVFARYWLPLLAYITLIFSLSAQPGLHPPVSFANSDKLAHILEYAGLGLLMARALRTVLPSRSWVFTSMLALGLGLCIGAGDEFFQSFIPGRDSTVFDWLADGMGLIFAQLAFLAWARDLEA